MSAAAWTDVGRRVDRCRPPRGPMSAAARGRWWTSKVRRVERRGQTIADRTAHPW